MSAPLGDIYLEPETDPDTLANLGPLRGMAGVWESVAGDDVHPVSEGAEPQLFVERYELQPIDAQTNGPQLFYGLRYHVHIVKPDEVETFHDQVGYWLWEPATGVVIQTIAIPRAQIAMASGIAAPDATDFEVRATLGSETYGICSNPFLQEAFRTTEFRMHVTIHDQQTWSYEEDTVMQVLGRDEPFHHTDANTLRRVAQPAPNPMASQLTT
jgi:hypothetical protein